MSYRLPPCQLVVLLGFGLAKGAIRRRMADVEANLKRTKVLQKRY